MLKFTRAMFKAVKGCPETGTLVLPTADYRAFKSFPDFVVFGEGSIFANGTVFGGNTGFGGNCVFGHYCLFKFATYFGAACRFGEGCNLSGVWHFGRSCVFMKGCSFDRTAEFGPMCSFIEPTFGGMPVADDQLPYISIDRAGSRNRRTTFFNLKSGIYVRSGCFWGPLEEFRRKVMLDEASPKRPSKKTLVYLGFANIACVQFDKPELVRQPYQPFRRLPTKT